MDRSRLRFRLFPARETEKSRQIAIVLLAWLVGSLTYVQIAAAKSLTFAYQTPTLNSILPLIVGMDFGFFAAEGLEVKPVFIRGGPTAAAALVGGEVDYTFVGGVPAVRAIAQGAPLVIVGGIQPYMDYTLIGAKGITSLNDLQGKIVGVTGAGGIAEYAAIEGLTKKGLVRDRNYKILYGVGNSPARAQAWRPAGSRPRRFHFSKDWNWSKRVFRCSLRSAKFCRDFPLS